MAFWSRNREPEPEGATLDWSPAEEVAEDPRIARIIIEHSLDPLNVDHQEIAADMLAMRARIDELVAEWSDSWTRGSTRGRRVGATTCRPSGSASPSPRTPACRTRRFSRITTC